MSDEKFYMVINADYPEERWIVLTDGKRTEKSLIEKVIKEEYPNEEKYAKILLHHAINEGNFVVEEHEPITFYSFENTDIEV